MDSLVAEPPVTAVRFDGPAPPGKATRDLPLKAGAEFDPADAQAAADRLMNAWRRDDYPLARVRWKATPSASGGGLEVVFTSEPGPRGRLRELRFTGNRALSAETLAAGLALRPARNWWDRVSGRDRLRLEDLARDRQALSAAYEEEGYLDVEIGAPQLDFLGEGAGFRLTWPVLTEGPVYRIRSARIVGDNVPPVRSLLPSLDLAPGSVAGPSRIRRAGERLREMLLERGYGFAEVAVEPAFDAATASADLTLTAQSGVAPVLREIRLIGNRRTRDRILRREIPLARGDRFDPAAIRQAQQNLLDTGLFSAVDVRYVGDARRPEFDLEVEVRERETGRAEMGFTYGTVEGAAFLIQVSERNLAWRPPWRGDALQARASALIGTEIRRLEAGLRNPRVGKSRWGADLGLFDEDNRYISESYDQRSRGFSVSASHPVGRHHALSLGYARTFFDVYNFEAGLTPSPEETDVDLAALALAWLYERVDDAFRPTQGVRLRQNLAIGLEALGGDTEVLQYRGRAAVFLPGPRSQALVLRLGVESVEARGSTATVPLPLRVWLGGSETLKGFAHRSVSPFGDGGIPVGGQSAWWSGAEYLVPAFPRLDISAYFEMGEVSADAWSFAGDARAANWGIGFIVRAENFPVRFDLAVPVTVAAGDRENERGEPRFSFSAGYRF